MCIHDYDGFFFFLTSGKDGPMKIGIYVIVLLFPLFLLFLVYKEDLEELDMEIGGPTDVKHVTHIGWDGSATPNPIMGWDNLISPELLSLPSVSLEQFELSRDRQVDAPLVNGST